MGTAGLWISSSLAFLSASGLVYVLATHFWPKIQASLQSEEDRFSEILTDIFYTGLTGRNLVLLKYLGSSAAFLFFTIFFGTPMFGLLFGVALYMAPGVILGRVRAKRLEKLAEQTVELIGALAATTKAGMTLAQSIEEISEKFPAPMREEFAMVRRRIETGMTLEASLLAMDQRLQIPGLSLVVQSIVVNQQRGGRLPPLLERIGESLREIERVEERVKTETSGIKLSSRLMAAMPLVIGFLLYLMAPANIIMLFNTVLGNAILVLVVVLDYIGFGMIRKIADIDI